MEFLKLSAMKRTMAFTAAIVTASAAYAGDPVVIDADHYKVILENDRVRVLEYLDQPGDATHEHTHPAFVL